MYYRKIILTDGIHILKQRSALCDNDGLYPRDLYYDTPEYQRIWLKKSPFAFKYRKNKIGYLSDNVKKLDTLLNYFGFSQNEENLQIIKEKLFDGKFAYENCIEFGYEKKPIPLKVWYNGELIEKNFSFKKYNKNSYQCFIKTDLTEYWDILNAVDYRNPEAIFTPFEEEGPIRKRILVGSDENA